MPGTWQDDLKSTSSGLVVPNGWSPEHGPYQDGTSYDQELVWSVFDNYIKASQILGVDADYRATVTQLRDQLYKPAVGSWGELTEWMNSSTEATYATNPELFRHTNHLVGLYPASEMTPDLDATRAAASQMSLVAHGETGDSASEWAAAWRTGLWARLQNGDLARHWLDLFFTWGCNPNLIGNLNGTPQWDGSFGFSGTIPELLLQSHAGFLRLLPALPSGWPAGSATGLKARGNYTVNLAWQDGLLTSASLACGTSGTLSLVNPWPNNALQVVAQSTGGSVGTTSSGGLATFATTVGETYLLSPGAAVAAPATPTGLAAYTGDTRVSLSWLTASGATSYKIKRSTDGTNFTTVGTATGRAFVNTGLTNGTTYFYQIVATNAIGDSGNSATVSVTPSNLGCISINFQGGSSSYGTPSVMAATETAGYFSANNWNNATGASGTLSSLMQSNGSSSSAAVTWSCSNLWSTPITESAGNYRMMKGYLDTSATSTTTVAVSGLPASFTSGGYVRVRLHRWAERQQQEDGPGTPSVARRLPRPMPRAPTLAGR
ncbi:MAG: fibronectin type III domain-containing protein [Chthoniobacteraceae bacterium]